MVATFTLTIYGFLILYSSTQALDQGSHLFLKQCIWCAVALLFLWLCSTINLVKLQTLGPWIGGLTLLLLMLVLIPGVSRCVKGSHRWIEFCGLRLQPSEPAKVGFVLFFSYFLTTQLQDMRHFIKGFLFPFGIAGCFCLLIILEPDFGTTALFGMVATILLFVRGIRLAYLLPSVLLAGFAFAVAVYLNPVRLGRVLSFLDLENNRLTGAYQLWQSLIAFSAGGWTGSGLGQGRQQFFFLPEAHTDFIGAVLAEELGIAHMMIMLFCFFCITFCGLKIVKNQGQPFLFYVGLGCVCFITIQVFLNLGVITGLLPTKGLALPFLSYGGSHLVTNFCFIGLLINLSRGLYDPLRELKNQ